MLPFYECPGLLPPSRPLGSQGGAAAAASHRLLPRRALFKQVPCPHAWLHLHRPLTSCLPGLRCAPAAKQTHSKWRSGLPYGGGGRTGAPQHSTTAFKQTGTQGHYSYAQEQVSESWKRRGLSQCLTNARWQGGQGPSLHLQAASPSCHCTKAGSQTSEGLASRS